MPPGSARFRSPFTHGYISRSHSPLLFPQKGTTMAAPLVVNDWLFVHAGFPCFCLDMSAVTHVLQPCQGSGSSSADLRQRRWIQGTEQAEVDLKLHIVWWFTLRVRVCICICNVEAPRIIICYIPTKGN